MKKNILILLMALASSALLWGQPEVIKHNVYGQQVRDAANAKFVALDSRIDTLTTDLNLVYVPLGDNIQTYIDAADAGSTIILASGVYTITSPITIDKELNIRGQGRTGFVTTPITPTSGTLISSSTASIVAFQINGDNVRISDLSMNLTGAASTGIATVNNLVGVVLNDVDIIVNSTGVCFGLNLLGSNVVMRDITFYVASSDAASNGCFVSNNSLTTQDIVVDAYNVTGTAVGGASYAYSFAAQNINDANTITLNLSNSICRGIEGTPLDIGVASASTTTNNTIVNCEFCTIDGGDYDFYQTGTNQLNVGGSLLKNGTTFGTITYRATMTAQNTTISDKITQTLITHSLTDGAPTDAELDAATSLTPATAGAGTIYMILDSDGSALLYRVVSDGTTWQYEALTIAL